jgi:hypothetical protein
MFTEDYLMRIINQALAVLMTAIGLKKAGKYLEARQAIQQAVEQVTTLPENIFDQMEDGSILSLLTAQGQLDVARLAVLADIYQEKGEILLALGQPIQGSLAYARALRFLLEVVLSEAGVLSGGNIARVEELTQRSTDCTLPVETQLALSDYYLRLLEMDGKSLNAAGTTREKIRHALARLKELPGSAEKTLGE